MASIKHEVADVVVDTLRSAARAMHGVSEVALKVGRQGRRNRRRTRDLDHFDADGNLKKNHSYTAGEHNYRYRTDANGRIDRVQADNLYLTNREKRLRHDPDTPGKLPGDHAGHLIGDRFGGSPEIDNLVSQLSTHNLGTFKTLENRWAAALEKGGTVTDVEIRIVSDASGRPTSFRVRSIIDGVKSNLRFDQ